MCFEQAEAYFNLITKVKPSELKRLTKWDDEIMESFKTHFPDYQSDEKLRILDENEMKSPAGKKRWRDFMMPFDKKIGASTLLYRNSCSPDRCVADASPVFLRRRVQLWNVDPNELRGGLHRREFHVRQVLCLLLSRVYFWKGSARGPTAKMSAPLQAVAGWSEPEQAFWRRRLTVLRSTVQVTACSSTLSRLPGIDEASTMLSGSGRRSSPHRDIFRALYHLDLVQRAARPKVSNGSPP